MDPCRPLRCKCKSPRPASEDRHFRVHHPSVHNSQAEQRPPAYATPLQRANRQKGTHTAPVRVIVKPYMLTAASRHRPLPTSSALNRVKRHSRSSRPLGALCWPSKHYHGRYSYSTTTQQGAATASSSRCSRAHRVQSLRTFQQFPAPETCVPTTSDSFCQYRRSR